MSFSDTLIYDFSLNVGDTVNSQLTVYGTVVSSIDSVLIGGGGYRKRFNLNTGYSYIEELGSNTGLAGALYPLPDDVFDLICFSHNNEFYPSTTLSCPLVTNTVGISETNSTQDNLIISPNPFSNSTTITIQSPISNHQSTIIITDILGKEIKTIRFSGKQYVLEKGEMNAGIYFISVISEQGIVNRKIIVQ